MEESIWALVSAHLSGNSTPQQEKELRDWREQNPEHEQLFDQYVQLWKASAPPEGSYLFDTDGNWQSLRSRIEQQENTIKAAPKPFTVSINTYLRVAAMVLLCLTIGYFLRKNTDPSGAMQVLRSGSSRMAVTLPDSSVVWLNQNSELSYPKAFTGNQREVSLVGEGFFEVKRNPEKPFVIRAATTRTQVLDTSFNLRAHPHQATVELSVVTGRVRFGAENMPAKKGVLTVGQFARWGSREGQLLMGLSQNTNFLAWKTRKLVFDKTPLREVVPALESCYGIAIDLEEPALQTCRFTGTFTEANLNDVLKALSLSLNLQTRTANGRYILLGDGCQLTP